MNKRKFVVEVESSLDGESDVNIVEANSKTSAIKSVREELSKYLLDGLMSTLSIRVIAEILNKPSAKRSKSMNNDIVLTQKDADTVRALLVNGMQVAGVASSKATYYHTAREQQEAVKKAVEDMFLAGRELPLLVAVHRGVRGYFIQEAILHDLANPHWNTVAVAQQKWDDVYRPRALDMSLKNLTASAGTPYALRMFVEAKDRKINNARTRRMALSYIFGHPSVEFMAVKYRNKLRQIIQHCLGERTTSVVLSIASKDGILTAMERSVMNDTLYRYNNMLDDSRVDGILKYIFGQDTDVEHFPGDMYPHIRQALMAREDVLGKTLVPEEVLLGLVSNPNHPQHSLWANEADRVNLLESIRTVSDVTTENIKLRRTKQERKLGIETKVDAKKVTDPMALLKTAYETGWTVDLKSAILELARKRRVLDFPYDNIVVVHDQSPSMAGHHRESKNTPRAISEFTYYVLNSSADVIGYSATNGSETDLSTAFLTAIKNAHYYNIGTVSAHEIEAIFVLSDGYENAQDGLFAQVLKKWREARDNAIPVYHISPIGAAEAGGMARQLAPNTLNVLSVGATAETLPAVIESHLLEADISKWLERAVKKLGG
jgi:hypothetical protein